MRPRRAAALLIPALVAAVTLAGCSGVPTGGPAQDVRAVERPPAPDAAPAPQDGQAPEVVIRGFVTSSADNRSDQTANNSFASARRYLTESAATDWNPQAAPVTILADEYRTVRGDDDTFVITGTQVGSLDADRAFRALPGRQVEIPLRMVQVDGQWRIDGAPEQLLITETDFDNNYLERSLYFLNRTGTVLVPDPRYLPRGTSTAGRVSRLVTMLLRGPSAALGTAATSRLGSRTQLNSNVSVDADAVVRVDLKGVERSTPQSELALAAQIAWTVRSEGIGVRVSIDGRPLDPQDPVYTTDSTLAFSPDGIPATGRPAPQDPYYLDPKGRIVSLTGQAMWGTLGVSGRVDSADMSAATGTLAAVKDTEDGQELLIGRPLQFQPAEPVQPAGPTGQSDPAPPTDCTGEPECATSVLPADTLTTPSFDRSGTEVWVVQNGATAPRIVRVTTGDTIGRQEVAAPGLAGKGPVTALTLSPDGVRVAVVADGVLFMGVIAQQQEAADGGAPTLSVVGLTELDPELDEVGPVVFRSSTQLLVGAKVGNEGVRTRTPQVVSIDGRQRIPMTDVGIFGDVSSLAVGGDVTLAAIGGENESGQVLRLTGSATTGRWDSPVVDTLVLDGSGPFIPH